MSADPRIAAYFTTVDEDLQAAEALIALGNRLAAFHMQQAIEKLAKVALIARGIEGGVEHHIDVLLKRLPDDDEIRARLWPLREYAAFATTFRYPKPGCSCPNEASIQSLTTRRTPRHPVSPRTPRARSAPNAPTTEMSSPCRHDVGPGRTFSAV